MLGGLEEVVLVPAEAGADHDEVEGDADDGDYLNTLCEHLLLRGRVVSEF